MTTEISWWLRLTDCVRAAGRGDLPLADPVRMIRDGLGFDCATLVGPQRPTGEGHPVLVNLDYPSRAVEFISTTYATQCLAHRYAIERRAARRFIDLPFDFRASRTYTEALQPCGFHEGLTLPLGGPDEVGGPGFLALSSLHGRPLSNESRLALTMLAGDLATLAAPRPDLPYDPADLVIWVSGDTIAPRVGRLADCPLATRDLVRLGELHRRHQTGLKFRHRGSEGSWWSVTTATTRDGVLVRLKSITPVDHLTARELDVVGLLSRGWTNDEIGESLGISVRTARSHIESALMKLNAPNRTALAREAVLNGIDSLIAIRCADEATRRELPV